MTFPFLIGRCNSEQFALHEVYRGELRQLPVLDTNAIVAEQKDQNMLTSLYPGFEWAIVDLGGKDRRHKHVLRDEQA